MNGSENQLTPKRRQKNLKKNRYTTKRQTKNTEHILKRFLDRGTADAVEHRVIAQPAIQLMACKELNFHNCGKHGSLAKLTIITKRYNKFNNNMKKELMKA